MYKIKPPWHVENVIIMVNNALAQKENTSFTVDMGVIFHINDIFKRFIVEVFNASL